jgi:hypothetical protein
VASLIALTPSPPRLRKGRAAGAGRLGNRGGRRRG